MIKLGPLQTSFWLFFRFLSLVAIEKIILTLFRSRFLSWSAERATYFREKVCYCFHFVFSGSGALYSAHSPVIERDWAPRLSFSCTTSRRNHMSNLYLAYLCHIFLRESSCKSRASCLEVNNNPSASSMLSIIKNAIVFYRQDSVEVYRLQ